MHWRTVYTYQFQLEEIKPVSENLSELSPWNKFLRRTPLVMGLLMFSFQSTMTILCLFK